MIEKEIKIKSCDLATALRLQKYIEDFKEPALNKRKTYNKQTTTNTVFTYNCIDINTFAEEFTAASSNSKRVKNPFQHYILSWNIGEAPSELQQKKAVEHFLKTMKYDLSQGGHIIMCPLTLIRGIYIYILLPIESGQLKKDKNNSMLLI